MRALSICSGGGGFDYAAQHLLGWQVEGYVEIAEYPQQIIAARIRDGVFRNAPIFGDLALFSSLGYAESYRGVAEVVFGGPPCQPFSGAGKSLGKADARDLSQVVTETVRLVRPRHLFMENSPGIKSESHADHWGDFLLGLAELGYVCRWDVLRACDVGGPHRRARLWFLATLPEWPDGADAGGAGRQERREIRKRQPSAHGDADEERRELLGATAERRPWLPETPDPWTIESFPSPVADGVARRSDKLAATGEGVVPLLAAVAWLRLSGA